MVSSYTAKDIEILEGLSGVRKRPAMYIGGTDENAYHHLFSEIIDNSMDEVVAGHAKNIDIHYNTNGTHLPPQEIFDLWSYFKHVEVAFSIDDVGAAFEYQRHPANWRQVSANLIKFKERKTPNMDFQTVSYTHLTLPTICSV